MDDKKHLKNFVAIFIVVSFTIYHIFLLPSSKHSNPKQLLQEKGPISPKIVNYSPSFITKELKQKISDADPFIIKGIPIDFFEIIDNYDTKTKFKNNNVVVTDYSLPKVGEKLTKLITDLTGMPIIFMTSLSGKYKGGFAHIDAFISYNFYYLKQGQKKVWIVPDEYSNLFKMGDGVDHIFVEEDAVGTDKLGWLDKVPYYYNFILNEGEVLLFNSSKCIHKFINLNGNEEAYSIRLQCTNGSPLSVKHNIGNWTLAHYYATVLVGKNMERDPYEYHEKN